MRQRWLHKHTARNPNPCVNTYGALCGACVCVQAGSRGPVRLAVTCHEGLRHTGSATGTVEVAPAEPEPALLWRVREVAGAPAGALACRSCLRLVDCLCRGLVWLAAADCQQLGGAVGT